MSGGRPSQLEEFDEAWVVELPASMVRRGLAAMPSAPPPPPKLAPPGISDQDVVDLLGLGIIASWRECVQRDPLGTERGSRVGLADLTKDFMAWNSCQRTRCSDFVYRKACALLSIGSPDDAVAVKKCCVFLCMYKARAVEWGKDPKARNGAPPFFTTAVQPGGEEPVSVTFPAPFVNYHSPNVMWRSCFSAMTCIVRALDETLWDGIDAPVLRMWRDARSVADIANLYVELKWGVPKSRQRNPAMWLSTLVNSALGDEVLRVKDYEALSDKMRSLERCIRCGVYLTPQLAAAHMEPLRHWSSRLVISRNGFVAVYGGHVRLLTWTVFCNNLSMFQHLLACPDVDVNARTILNNGGMTEFTPLHATATMLASKPTAEVMLKMLLDRPDLNISCQDADGNTVLHLLVNALTSSSSSVIGVLWPRFLRAILRVKQLGVPLLARDRRNHYTARDVLMRSDNLRILQNLSGRTVPTVAAELEQALSL